MDDQSAARGADEACMVDAKRCQSGDDVFGLDDDVILLPVWIVGRLSTSPIIERDNFSRALAVLGEEHCQFMEVSGVSREARQADDRPSFADVVSVDSRMQFQSVGRRVKI